MKIFWRIFMRQISLTDYFCKGLRPSENRKTTMTASMYILLLLALIFANAPFITTKFFGIIALKRKHIGHHLIELLAGFLLTAILAYILESRAGAVHAQDWEFYATVVCLYLIFAFPCFVWRYFWNERNRE